jgi:hypothetical protein
MFSDAIELLGLACLVAGVFVLLGLGAALLAAGGCLLIVGAGVDDARSSPRSPVPAPVSAALRALPRDGCAPAAPSPGRRSP